MVFVIDPLVLRVPRFLLGFASLDKSLRFDRSKATQVILAPRDGGKPRIAECEPFFHYHINNAFDEGGGRRARPRPLPGLRQHPPRLPRLPARRLRRRLRRRCRRMRVSPSDEVDDRGPLAAWLRVPAARLAPDEQLTATLLAGHANAARARRAVQRDHQDRPRARRHDGARARRRARRRRADLRSAHADSAEDDGWLLSLVYSAAEHRSRLVVLDARDVESDRWRSRTCATTSRSDSTARSRTGRSAMTAVFRACLAALAGLESIVREATT